MPNKFHSWFCLETQNWKLKSFRSYIMHKSNMLSLVSARGKYVMEFQHRFLNHHHFHSSHCAEIESCYIYFSGFFLFFLISSSLRRLLFFVLLLLSFLSLKMISIRFTSLYFTMVENYYALLYLCIATRKDLRLGIWTKITMEMWSLN